jgi:hypothetical protein
MTRTMPLRVVTNLCRLRSATSIARSLIWPGMVLTLKPPVILESDITAERAPWQAASSYRFTMRMAF